MSRLQIVGVEDHRNIQSEKPSPTPTRRKQQRIREKEYLDDREVEQLMQAAREGRHGIRDQLLILFAWRHGLRCEELVSLKLNQINIPGRELYVMRVKGSHSTHHPMQEDEVRLLRRYLKVRQDNKGASSDHLFLTERGEGMKPHAFNYLLKTIGERAGFMFRVHPHQLRHSCGFHLANRGLNAFTIATYLGHRQIQNSMCYVHVSAAQFRNIW
jgi:type 1 fimbriae regulatory protein FimB